MPASSLDLYQMQDARNNFEAMRPAPLCAEASQLQLGQCQNVHISTNCYYGYHDSGVKNANTQNNDDYDMLELPSTNGNVHQQSRKRSADEDQYPQSKRPREEVQRKKHNAPETNEKTSFSSTKEDLLETLYWNIHGGNIFHLHHSL